MRQGTARDLIGGRLFWAAASVSFAGLVAALQLRAVRAWIGLIIFAMWTLFSLVNAVRSRRVHSIVSAPVYLMAALVAAGAASGRIDVQIWMIAILAAGLIAANLAERVLGKYL
jgi:hypothetical protein